MQAADRVFISYRRDDAAGYAGRLEEALERRLGSGSVFRDVLDIAPGADFVQAIRTRLAGAQAVLVLIGPRWAGPGPDGRRRIDDPQDFVRLEVAEALASSAQVVPLLLPGATMPAEAELPPPLQPLARRNALALGDTHWEADVGRLTQALGLAPPPRRRGPLLAGAAVLVLAAAGGWWVLRPAAPPPAPVVAPDLSARLLGSWSGPLRYPWGDRYTERFEFKRHAGELTGTAGFLGVPRAVEGLRFDGSNLHFQTRSQVSMNGETRVITHVYAAELRGQPPDEVLAFRLVSRGGFDPERPVDFEARRVAPEAAASAASR